ncbi:MAG: hypothetical protein WKF52_06525 [Sphingomicrobium sp.]
MIVHDSKDLRITLLDKPALGISACPALHSDTVPAVSPHYGNLLALILCGRPEVRDVQFKVLLIEAYDGYRVRQHVPTAIVEAHEGLMILDVHETFGSGFLAHCINEQASRALGWRVETLEATQIASQALMDLAPDTAAEIRAAQSSENVVVDVAKAVAIDPAVGKASPSFKSIAHCLKTDAGPSRGKAVGNIWRHVVTPTGQAKTTRRHSPRGG